MAASVLIQDGNPIWLSLSIVPSKDMMASRRPGRPMRLLP